MENNICYKCKSKATYKHRNNIMTCDQCFMHLIMSKKYRSFMHKNADFKISKDCKTAILLSLGANSLSLSMLMGRSTTIPANGIKRKLYFNTELIFVNEKAYYDYFNIYYDENIENKIKDLGEKLKMKIHHLKIEDYEEFINNKKEKFFKIKENQDILNNLPMGDYKSDYLVLLRNRIINKFLQENNFKYALSADNSDTLARKSFSFICKGQGDQMIQETSPNYVWNNITYLRPMYEFTNKEVLFYLSKNNLNNFIKIHDKLSITNTNLKTKNLPGQGSLDLLLGEFLQDINKKFPSTISTVLRTTNKIVVNEEYHNICYTCGGRFKDKCLGCFRIFN